MDTLRTTILTACTLGLGLTLAEQLIPLERFSAQIRLLLSLLLLIGMLSSLTRISPDTWERRFDATAASTEEIQALAEQAHADAIAESIANALNRKLEEAKVNCRVSAVTVHIGEDGSIDISEVTITGNTLTGSIYLREWLGDAVSLTKEVTP